MKVGDRVYVAARFERAEEAEALARELERAGYIVTSQWHHDESTLALGRTFAEGRAAAEKDLTDLARADALILLTDDVPGRGGKDFEAGYARALRKEIVVVGPRCHVFHYLPDVRHVDDVRTFRMLYLNGEKIDEIP